MLVRRVAADTAVVVLHDDHLSVAGQLAHLWGNEAFEPPDRFVVHLARNHDAGWAEYDIDPVLAADGLPAHMPDVPIERLAEIHRRSIDRNYGFHPYAGVLACVHHLGFYRGRFGVSDYLVHHLDDEPGRSPEVVGPFVAETEEKQRLWTEELAARNVAADLVEHERLMREYTFLQVFDTMSLYFCTNEGSSFAETEFPNIPASASETKTVRVAPRGDATFVIDPWPFGLEGNGALHLVVDRRIVRAGARSILDAPAEQVVCSLLPCPAA